VTIRSAAVAVALAVVTVTLPGGSAQAAPGGLILDVDTAAAGPGRIGLSVSATDGSTAVKLQPGSLTVTVTGPDGRGRPLQPVDDTAPSGPTGALMLVLDTSGSMVDEDRHVNRIVPMKRAALALLDALPPGVQVGLVTFGDPARVLVEPGPDSRADVARRIPRLEATGDTALFEAVSLAAAKMPPTGSRRIVMLTDGSNDQKTRPVVTAEQAADRLRAKGSPIRFTAVKIVTPGLPVGKDPNRLATLSGQSRARVQVATDSTLERVLGQEFRTTVEDFERQLTRSFVVPPALAGRTLSARISVRTHTGAPVTSTSRTLVLPGGTAPAPTAAAAPERPRTIGGAVATAGLVALFLALATLLAVATGAVGGGRDEETEVLRRLEVYSVSGARPDRVEVREQTTLPRTRLGDSRLTRSAVHLMTRVARSSRLDSALDGRLEAAGLPLRTAEWMLLHVGAAVGGALLFTLLAGGRAAAALVGLPLGLALPWLFLIQARARRRSRFLAQLPDTLQMLAGSLAAGYSLPQAMDAVVRESAAPIKVEFNRALIEARLGMLAEDALDGIARRTDSEDFSWIVMAIRIQRDVGGNLAELLSTVASTLRERERLRRQVSSLSAEGKLSGVILGALPVVFALYLMLTRPEYLAPLFSTAIGVALLVVGGVLLAIGAFWMAKMVRVDV
jgi:tight adherence protein B